MGISPFNLITPEGGERDREIIAASCNSGITGTRRGAVTASRGWRPSAHGGRFGGGVRHLDIYGRAFILRNGFHANGDQTKSGLSDFTYRPFTLEGNFLAMAAVHEMLLQSWSAHPGRGDDGSHCRLFPAIPWRWHEASFEDLRGEGGHWVSARRENNATTWLRVVSGRDGPVHIRDNFGGREPRWSRGGVEKVGDNFEVALKRGEIIEATLPKPKEIPFAPANVAPDLHQPKPAAVAPPQSYGPILTPRQLAWHALK